MDSGAPADIRQEATAIHIRQIFLSIGPRLAIDDLVVGEDDVVGSSAAHQQSQNRGDGRLAEVGSLVTIYTVPIHNTKHPQAWNRCQVTLNAVTVLVDLAHLRNKTGSRLHANLLNYLRCSTSTLRIGTGYSDGILVFLRVLLDVVLCRPLSTNVNSGEVGTLLQVLSARWIYLDKIVATEWW